jgi:hypothetical protein
MAEDFWDGTAHLFAPKITVEHLSNEGDDLLHPERRCKHNRNARKTSSLFDDSFMFHYPSFRLFQMLGWPPNVDDLTNTVD